MNRHPDLGVTDERLREWAYFFRDRRRLEQCRSIEHRFKATSDDSGPEGWGDEEAAPSVRPGASYQLLRALQTHEAIQELEKVYKWALTYGYAYPGMPKFAVLRCMKKYTGRRMTWKAFLETLDIGRFRVHTSISCRNLLTA